MQAFRDYDQQKASSNETLVTNENPARTSTEPEDIEKAFDVYDERQAKMKSGERISLLWTPDKGMMTVYYDLRSRVLAVLAVRWVIS